MSGEILFKCETCRYNCGDHNKCSYQSLEKNYKAMRWECKSYIYDPNSDFGKLKEEIDKSTNQLGELAKWLLQANTTNKKQLIKIMYNNLESYISCCELLIEELQKEN